MWKTMKRTFNAIYESFHPLQLSSMHAQDGGSLCWGIGPLGDAVIVVWDTSELGDTELQ